MSIKLKSLVSRGDTIVEVMVVLAVLGLALSISYATASRSLKNTRQAQENSEASSLAQSQIEALRSMASPGNVGGDIFQVGPYCINTSVVPYAVVLPLPVPPSTPCSANPRYAVKIDYVASPLLVAPAKGGKFTVTITWPDVTGQGNDTVTSVYRLYQ